MLGAYVEADHQKFEVHLTSKLASKASEIPEFGYSL